MRQRMFESLRQRMLAIRPAALLHAFPPTYRIWNDARKRPVTSEIALHRLAPGRVELASRRGDGKGQQGMARVEGGGETRGRCPVDVMSEPIAARLGREGKNAEGTLDEQAERPPAPIAGSGSTAEQARSEDPHRCFPRAKTQCARLALGKALANATVSRPASPSPRAPEPGMHVPRRRRCTARPQRDPRSRRRPHRPLPRPQIPGCRASTRRRG